jgi:hypothetical protein
VDSAFRGENEQAREYFIRFCRVSGVNKFTFKQDSGQEDQKMIEGVNVPKNGGVISE